MPETGSAEMQNAPNGMIGRHDISAIARLPSMSDLAADL